MSKKSPYYTVVFDENNQIAVTTESLRDTLLTLWLIDRINLRFPGMRAEGIAALLKELRETGRYQLECPPDWEEHSTLSGNPVSILPPKLNNSLQWILQTTPEAEG